jgi:hypothetical protein
MTIDGGGRRNKMYINSKALFFNLHIKTEVEFSGQHNLVTINGGTWIEDTIYVKNGAILKVACSNIETGSKPSCFIDKGGWLAIDNCTLESSADEVIGGDGSLRLGNVTFPIRSKIADTLEIQQASNFFKTTQKAMSEGTAEPLPAAPSGYFITNVNGHDCLVPYYSMP